MSSEDTAEPTNESAGLGSVFDAIEGSDAERGPEAQRGDDLHATVEVPRWVLGFPEGHRVALPVELDGGTRVVHAGDETSIPLHLPESFPEGGTLRLRGQGGVGRDGGRAGDLFLSVRLTDEPAPPGALARRAKIEKAVANIGESGSEPDVFMWILGIALLGAIGFMLFV